VNFSDSSLYKEYRAELDEILKHKWIESEKVGKDIGWEKALMDWIFKYKADWKRSRKIPLANQRDLKKD